MSIERRVCTRKTPKHLGYLSLPFNNGGIVLDVSEGGLGFRSIAPVIADGPIHFRFAIDSGKRIKAVGELAWKDETGKIGGLRFTQLSDEIREQIRVWANQTDVVVNAEAKPRVLDVQVAEPAIEVKGVPSSNAEFPSGEADSRPLLYNSTPPIYSAPFNKLSRFPLGLDSGAATAAVLPQFIQVLDEIREQVRDWAAQSNAGVYDNPFGDPAFEGEVALRSETDLALAENIPVAESATESEDASRGKAYLTPAVDGLAAEPVIEADVTPGSESDLNRIVAAGNPLLYNLKPPVYSASFNGLSMFPPGLESEAAAADLAIPKSVAALQRLAALRSAAKRHPIAAIGMTIVLAFVVSMGIIAYAATSPAGKMIFDWGAEMWGGSNSQPAPQNAVPPVSGSQDSSRKPRQ